MDITIVREKLSNGSYVYNLQFTADTIHAISKTDAKAMYEKIADAINEHSVDEGPDANPKVYLWEDD